MFSDARRAVCRCVSDGWFSERPAGAEDTWVSQTVKARDGRGVPQEIVAQLR